MTEEEKALLAKEKELIAQKKPVPNPFRVSLETVKRMSDALVENINKLVREDDVLWVLGDFSMGDYGVTKGYRGKIRCKNVHLIRGNHDTDKPEHFFGVVRDLVKVSIASNGNYYLDAKSKIVELVRGTDGKAYRDTDIKEVVLCHYAMAAWDRSHRGSYHFYGHAHGGIEQMMDEKFPMRGSLDVGVDNAFKLLGEYRPFSLDEAVDIIEKRRAKALVNSSYSPK